MSGRMWNLLGVFVVFASAAISVAVIVSLITWLRQ